jgi:hypothetical protein
MYMLIFRRIFLSNYWWQKSDIWSQASYRYPISWEAFLDPVQKRFPQYGIPIWSLWPSIRFLSSIVAEKNATKNVYIQMYVKCDKLHIGTPYRGKRFWTHQIPTSCLPNLLIFIHIEHTCICSFFVAFSSATYKCMLNVYKNQQNLQTGSRNLMGPKRLPTISWEAFLDPSDSYFLFAKFGDFYTHWTYMYMLIFRRIFLSNYWWQKSDIWSQASYRYPISWEAFLDPPKTLPTIWHTYMKLVTKYQIPVINSCWEKCD